MCMNSPKVGVHVKCKANLYYLIRR
jgi:hypothetical protein